MFRKTGLASLVIASALTWSLPSFALGDVTIYDNAQSVPVGGRAAGMGGASTAHSIPSVVGAVRILSEGSERTFFDTYPQRLTFGFTVSVPRTVALKVERPKASDRDYASFSIREDLTIGYLGLGYQFNKEIS